MEHVNDVVQSIYENEKPPVFENQGINVYIHPAGAAFIIPTEIKMGEEVIFAKNTIISTGSSPRMVPHSGGQMPGVLTYNNF
jgi:pyruvate/2-oxoglutarate dehydrogenase complex dihydrolipoamide dehydrogenase (E3) component